LVATFAVIVGAPLVAVGGTAVDGIVAVGGGVPDGDKVGVTLIVVWAVNVRTAPVSCTTAVSVWEVSPVNCGLTYIKNITSTTIRQTINTPNSARMI
jgi:hypothetical protein